MKRVLAVATIVAILIGLTGGITLASEPGEGFASLQNGGGMITRDGTLEVAVPPDCAPPFDLQLKYQLEDETYIPAILTNGMFIGHPFDIRVARSDNGSVILTTDKPITLTIHYTGSDISGVNEASLRFAQWVDTQWVNMPSTINTDAKTVTTQIHGSSTFGLVGGGSFAPIAAPAPAPAVAAPTLAQSPAVPMNSTISGKVFYDKNGNGVMDGDDFPIAGAGLKISSGTWSAFTTSAADGSYYFASLKQSACIVELVVGPEWAFTTAPAVSNIQVSGQADTSPSNVDFGMWYKLP